ncbi:hypothetical protein E2562_033190 [Oryza meyeriana var. granulata]|uniref:J domain-containing protein n=1 Tax=Oryza meyeriana var. granulata TaxID=110450 RepID=A0A6G1DRP9_9ORYZ|nr:hypothetical protein E2562_033190 [Oryza meyeriana var. granulata]
MSWGRFNRAPFPSGMPAMARCSRHNPPAPRTVVVIDEDDDLGDGPSDEEVFIIDGATAKGRAASGCKTKRGNSSCSNVINLDDEEEGGGGGDRAGPSAAYATGSPAATTPVRVSPRNRYGLDYISDSCESDSSEEHSDGDDGSDCEILDDTSGTARKQWEKAASRKSMPQGLRKSTSTSSAESSTQPDENAENGAECHLNEFIWKYFSDDVLKEGVPISTSGANAKASVPDAHECSKDNASNANEAEDCNATSRIDPGPPCLQDGIIGEREKHKESDEYKRAEEEEWASRQRQLRIQAEEAQRLRKRKKAEAMRLLDMEKRQKQRLEEVRESQRKNEEDIQLKEKYRGVVRLELENMERRYIDMASILRALGITVESGEVKAAYKQALLKFHPDRVSRSDMYQQVKAEETFKFISRLKEKLLRAF